MNIKLIKPLNEELIKVIEDTQKKIENHSLTDAEFLEFVQKVGEKNSLILEEVGISTDF